MVFEMRNLLPIFVVLCSGCASTTVWRSPKLSGKIVNQSGAPIEGVKIVEINPNFKILKPVGKSDATGHFELTSESDQVRGTLNGSRGYFVFEKEGYQSAALAYHQIIAAPAPRQMPDATIILLKSNPVSGYRLAKIAKGNIYEKMGLKEGDIIKKFNGKLVDGPSAAMQLYNSINTAKKVELVIERDGKNQIIQFDSNKQN